jgi:DNA-directed RNA polymerase subunit N (RpoN/RPB10)|tara:strand:+ start:63 stop:323 length:261 start_codon:yes stop_codon:yes gene_type:complete
MIIPPRCFTCGTVIGDKWIPFVETVLEEKQKSTEEVDTELDIDYIDVTNEGKIKKSIEGKTLDKLNMHKYCCRRMFLGNVHLITHI